MIFKLRNVIFHSPRTTCAVSGGTKVKSAQSLHTVFLNPPQQPRPANLIALKRTAPEIINMVHFTRVLLKRCSVDTPCVLEVGTKCFGCAEYDVTPERPV